MSGKSNLIAAFRFLNLLVHGSGGRGLTNAFSSLAPGGERNCCGEEGAPDSSPFPVWQMSDGELCFIALLSLIFAPEELGSPLYCLEEPENHLHPKLLQTLLGLLEQRQRVLGNKAAQIIATTHSLELVDRCAVEDLVVLERRDGSSLCTRPGEKQAVQELLAREELGLGDLYYSGVLNR